MKKLIMGLSCLSVLSMVSCDNNEHSEKVPPSLGSVSFSASTPTAITIAQGDKVKLKIVDKDDKVIKYYKDADRITGTTFPDAGQEFTFNANGTIKDGLYIEASSDAYSIVKFDLTDVSGKKKYELKEKVILTVTASKSTSPTTVALVEKKEGTVTGVDDKGQSVSFSTSDVTSSITPFSFMVQFKATGASTLLNSKKDGDDVAAANYYKISFTVKDDNNGEIYKVEDLFKQTGIAGKDPGFSTFTIKLNREIAHYSNLKISGSIQKGSTSATTIADKTITSTDKLITLQSS